MNELRIKPRATKRGRPPFDPAVFLQTVAKGRTISTHRNKDIIFSQGGDADAVFYIRKGKIKVTVISKQGKEAVIAILGADEFVGEGCLSGQLKRLATATAMTECVRAGTGQLLAEFVATFGLLLTIFGCLSRTPAAVPYAVGLYITSAYWFTASTSFANPAVTIARSISDTFAGIAPSGAPAFIAAQFTGAFAALALTRWLWPCRPEKPIAPATRTESARAAA